jgi:hypothetical protein
MLIIILLSFIKLSTIMPSVIMLSVILLRIIKLSVKMLSVIMFSAIMLSAIMLNDIMLSAIMLNDIMLSATKCHYAGSNGVLKCLNFFSLSSLTFLPRPCSQNCRPPKDSSLTDTRVRSPRYQSNYLNFFSVNSPIICLTLCR